MRNRLPIIGLVESVIFQSVKVVFHSSINCGPVDYHFVNKKVVSCLKNFVSRWSVQSFISLPSDIKKNMKARFIF